MSGTLKHFGLGLASLFFLAMLLAGPAVAQTTRPGSLAAARPAPGRQVASPPRPTAAQAVRPASHVMPATPSLVDDSAWSCDSCGESDVVWGAPACGAPNGCLPLWGSIEYLLWWESDAKYPPLVTTSPNGTPRDDAGILGLGSTSILFGGNQPIESGTLSGGRLTLGLWLDPCQTISIVGRGFGIEQHGDMFAASSAGNQILARPFFNAFTNEPDSLLLGFPGEIRGNVQVTQDIQTQGAEAFLRQLYRSGCNYRIDLVYGYRYLGVDDSLKITNALEFTDPTGNTFGNTLDQIDVFDLENEFHGGELGLMGHSVDGRWTLDFLGTVALGNMQQRATIRGNSVSAIQGANPVTVNGGLLTQDSNIGTFKDNAFAVVPEFTATLGYFITPRLDLSVGYTFLYVNHVSRPGQVIDSAVNLTQQTGTLEGPARPAFQFQDSDYWLQGLNIGLNLRY